MIVPPAGHRLPNTWMTHPLPPRCGWMAMAGGPTGVGDGVGLGVGDGVGLGVGDGVRDRFGFGDFVGVAVGFADFVGVAVGSALAEGEGEPSATGLLSSERDMIAPNTSMTQPVPPDCGWIRMTGSVGVGDGVGLGVGDGVGLGVGDGVRERFGFGDFVGVAVGLADFVGVAVGRVTLA